MRAVFIGTSSLTVSATRLLLERGHEVVIVESEKENIDALSEELDCGFLHGDGSKPNILREADPQQTDVLFCLTGHDQTNILASLVGQSLGFSRTITRIEDPDFEHICLELGLEDTIVPARTIGRYLADMFEGRDPLDLLTMIRNEARPFSFVAREDDAGPVADLALPGKTRVVCIYRQDAFLLPDDDMKIQIDDEVVLITDRKNIPQLEERWTRVAARQRKR